MSFKLLAIRPLIGCDDKILKNLKIDEIYKFYNDYQFEDGIAYSLIDNQPSLRVKIASEKRKSAPENLYGNNINVSAIVGKNGSGKSALVELLIATIIKISLVVDRNFIKPDELYYDDFERGINNFNKSIKTDLEKLKVEIYYEHSSNFGVANRSNKIVTYNSGSGKKIRCIQLDGENVIIKDQINRTVKYFRLIDLDQANPNKQKLSQELYYFLGDLFYSMVINYSHYGFNPNEIGEWIRGVFHKNDGYQLPVVINPYRDNGNIDINSEKDLAKSRFLVNILQEKELRIIQKFKAISHISISLDQSKFRWEESKMSDRRILNTEDDKRKILNVISQKFYIKNDLFLNQNNYFYNYALDYLLIKLFKITNYPIYREYRKCFEEITVNINGEKINQFRIIPGELFENYVESLFVNFSHVTHKFRQALFFLEYIYFDISDVRSDGSEKILEIGTLYDWINSSYLKGLKSAIESYNNEDEILFKESLMQRFNTGKFESQHSLPSFFKIEYFFEDKISNNNFSNLSSGEKQKIFSLHSVLYHLRNLISISENNSIGLENNVRKLITYKNINIIFDEIELYAHPDFQRIFISDLLKSLKAINMNGKYLNILFITHSPFILSDIPKQNVLFLEVDELSEKSTPGTYEGNNTFGANIHEMLTNGFFMESTKGEFSIFKINEFLDFYKVATNLKKDSNEYNKFKADFENKDKKYFKDLIFIIGEDFIRNILNNHLLELYNHFDISFEEELSMMELEERKKVLENELDELKKRIENEKN